MPRTIADPNPHLSILDDGQVKKQIAEQARRALEMADRQVVVADHPAALPANSASPSLAPIRSLDSSWVIPVTSETIWVHSPPLVPPADRDHPVRFDPGVMEHLAADGDAGR